MVAAVAWMWESGFFTEEKLIEWEKKKEVDQNRVEVQSYFGELYHDHNNTPKQLQRRRDSTIG